MQFQILASCMLQRRIRVAAWGAWGNVCNIATGWCRVTSGYVAASYSLTATGVLETFTQSDANGVIGMIETHAAFSN